MNGDDKFRLHNNTGVSFRNAGLFDKAIEEFGSAIELNGSYAYAYYNRSESLFHMKRFQEALADIEKAIDLAPNLAEARNVRGNIFRETNRAGEALENYDRAISLRPTYAEAFNNRGAAFSDLHRFDEAKSDYLRAIAIDPSYAQPHVNLCQLHLLRGNLTEGWSKYAWRWKGNASGARAGNGIPKWTGAEDLVGKTIMVYFEQGLGDTIQFGRYAQSERCWGDRHFRCAAAYGEIDEIVRRYRLRHQRPEDSPRRLSVPSRRSSDDFLQDT
jgi:tetratricopeptide (TPR) repeat protein